ncbi:alpha-glucosidase domain-containing protein [Sinobaca sp. H24]|uniref:alpha-glucosidase domain-containing protein n=1 Tax=Sinobaca sp. H24 TaxID=2923376 RepID=UPI00207A5A67|nr:alpha-glucosidase domain-containing protein [Sinobaca sp. H24]
MKDTSFAIHPDHQQTAEEVTFQDIGNVTAVSEGSEAVSLTCEYGYVRISFPAPGIARVKMDPKKMPEDTSTAAVVKQQQPEKITVQEMEEVLAVKTKEIRLSISKYPCRITMYDKDGEAITDEQQDGMSFSSRGEVRVRKKMEPEDHFYGFGEKTGFLEKRGEKMRMWNTDVFALIIPK